ncbi:glycosyltransferase family 4 protein [Lutimonas zeaxanthinifaciens]|uniref:glycosyltransferase family 4 protein n=1 Tax=Lutimonas zeaxanthinifaciens TaxID=3060215 RepID=UPI00265D3F67|nr:glycosyltransferase family 4 protein [Lutimonas sp. YSD2104]WKK66773.1 glycosyltransferase family 4 protein [Lutimonas sp. YSD2104]
MPDSIKICFLADRHHLFDDRIYWKMAVPLVLKGYEVHYLLLGDKNESGVTREGINYKIWKIKTFSKNQGINFVVKRLNPFHNYKKLFKEAAGLRADIYHFHDLWINRIGVKLKKLSHRPVVFYDAREPYAEDYVSYGKKAFRWATRIFAAWVDQWEKKKARNYDLVIANESGVQQNFSRIIGPEKSVVLYNYGDRILREKKSSEPVKDYDLIYTGTITRLRGAMRLLRSVKIISKELPALKCLFIGNFYPNSLKDEMNSFLKLQGLEKNVVLHNAVPYQEIGSYYNKSKIGLLVLERVKTYEISMPIKLFEYMTFGLPVIGSNFGHVGAIIEQDKCGIAVDPSDPVEIANSVIKLLNDHKLYAELSNNGRQAADTKYNWENEFQKLLGFYHKALNER